MPEAEVALRLAFYLLSLAQSKGTAVVAIDGAQVKVGDAEVFPIEGFLLAKGWQQVEQSGKNSWQGTYILDGKHLNVHSDSGSGDVVVPLESGQVRAECKKGPLVKKKGSQERPLLNCAIGQLMTVRTVCDNDFLVAAVPKTDRFAALAREWQSRPLIERSGIRIVLVGRDGSADGIPSEWLMPCSERYQRFLELAGQIDYDPDYDYKAERRRR